MSGATVGEFLDYWRNEGEAYARRGDYAWMAGLVPGRRVLEIGCGWGGFAERALDRGIRVTGLTLSDEQLRFATERIAGRPDGGQAAFRLEDYRDHQTIARYDGIASIEMFEAVGERY